MWDGITLGLYAIGIDSQEDDEDLQDLLAISILGIQIFKIIDTYLLAEQYNDNLFKTLFNNTGLSFSLKHPNKNELLLGFSIPID